MKRQSIISIIIISAISIALYVNTLKNDFVYDDEKIIVANAYIKDISNISALFNNGYYLVSGEMTYRPIVTLSYFMDYDVFELEPWGFHLTNVLIHTLNGILLYIFLTLLIGVHPETSSPTICILSNLPLIIAILFTSHPLATESVNVVSYREDLLVFFFFMAALNMYLMYRSELPLLHRRCYYLASLVAYFLALLSKEMAITLPLIIYCYEWIYNDKNKRLSAILSYIVITLLWFLLNFYYFRNPNGVSLHLNTISERLPAIPYLFLSYLKLALFPISLSVDYVIIPTKSFFSTLFILPFAITLALLISAVIIKKRVKDLTFGIFFLAITLVPVYNIVPIANIFAERYSYLPLVGIAIVIGYTGLFLSKIQTLHLKFNTRNISMPIIFIVCIYSVLVINRNEVWKNNYLLWTDTIKKMPNSSRAHNSLGVIYYRTGRLHEAAREYKTALELNPYDPKSHFNLGLVYAAQKRFEEAIHHYQAALSLIPDDLDILTNIGIAYTEKGKMDEAEQAFSAAIMLTPNNAMLHNNIGVFYDRQGRLSEAMEEFQTAIRLEPVNYIYHSNLGNIYEKQGRFHEALKEFQIALRLKPGDANILSRIGDLSYKVIETGP